MHALPVFLAAAGLAASAAYAQAPVKPGGYPAKPVRAIVPFPAGGAGDFVHVPYKGTSLLLPDLLSGQIAMAVDTPPAHVPFIKAGKLRALALTAAKRASFLPGVPTMVEAGLPGFESVASYALLAPAGASKDIVAFLNREINAVLQLADVQEKLSVAGIDPAGSSPEALDAFTKAEVVKWAQVIKAAGIAPE